MNEKNAPDRRARAAREISPALRLPLAESLRLAAPVTRWSARGPALLLLLAAALSLAPPARASLWEDVETALKGSPLLIYGRSPDEARAVLADCEAEQIPARIMAAARVKEEDLRSSDIFVFGTPETNPLIPRLLAKTPFHLTASAVAVGDSTYEGTDLRLVASLPHPFSPERKCILYAAQDEEMLSGIFFGYGASAVAAEFLTYRKSDGLYYQDDRLAYGTLVRKPAGVELGEVTYAGKEPRRLHDLALGHVRLYYDTFDAREARTIAAYVDALVNVAAGDFGIRMPERIYVYLYSASVEPTRIRMYTDAWNTFWCKMTVPKADFLRTDPAPVAFAHEVARLAFQPVVGDTTKRHPFSPYDDDWSHYFQFMVLVPAVWAKLGPACWPAPNNFHDTWGAGHFQRLYHGAENTYASLLYAIEQKYGRALIGRTVNEVTHRGARRNVPIEEFMAQLAAATKDSAMVRRVAAALPTTLEWSLDRRIEPLGLIPNLDRMIEDDDFTVDSVAAASPMDSAGIRPGDEIVGINGFDLETGKARAHRSVLEAIPANGAIRLTVKRGGQTLTGTVKIRRR